MHFIKYIHIHIHTFIQQARLKILELNFAPFSHAMLTPLERFRLHLDKYRQNVVAIVVVPRAEMVFARSFALNHLPLHT